MTDFTLYIVPIIAAFIGYVTNYIAVKMLFHPRKPINLLVYKVQGIFPKRKHLIAKSIGNMISSKLLSIENIVEQIDKEQLIGGLKNTFEPKIDIFLQEKLPVKFPMLSMFLDDSILNTIKTTIMENLMNINDADIKTAMGSLLKGVNIQQMVETKIMNFSVEELENMLHDLLKKEFRFIEFVGAVLGFLIGLLQVGIVNFHILEKL